MNPVIKFFCVCLVLLNTISVFSQEIIDLSGTWRFAIDHDNLGVSEAWYEQGLKDQVQLPGSMPENMKGDEVTFNTKWTGSLYDSSYYYNSKMEKYRRSGNIRFPFFLTPVKHYEGVAWYQKTVTIPDGWKGKVIQLFLERPHIETTVWVDEKQAGEDQYSLCVPHVYDLTKSLTVGMHTITVRVDNTIKDKYNPGIDSHSITDQTQGNWNGIVGKINLMAHAPVYFDDIQVFPNLSLKKAIVKVTLQGEKQLSGKGKITLSAQSFNSDEKHQVPELVTDFTLVNGIAKLEIPFNMGDGFLTWDEFDPALYKLRAVISFDKTTEEKEVQFGMREFTIKGKWFYVNGNKTVLRGTVENCCFPLTGYAPMDVDSWLKVFKACRDHGLNHMRFHSFCPPEAAFVAADIAGFYLQPEGPSWPNHGVRLGNGMAIDTFLMKETRTLTKAYGNYASYCMLACGNEPAGRWVPWVSNFVHYWEKTDTRRVYTGASVGNGWQWQPDNQYHVKAGARGLSWGGIPESISDYCQHIDTVRQPYVSHETGQWCAFPNFNEITKYTGVNKAKNFEIFRDLLAENDMVSLSNDFMMASGKLQAICYKHEIEKTLRTPDYAGFQLLCLNDYSGQGTALVGVLDVFWEEKGYISPERFRRFCNSTVPLVRMEKFIFKNSETLNASLEVAHFGKSPIKNARFDWTIKNDLGLTIARGSFRERDIPLGNCFKIGDIKVPLEGITKATQLNLEVSIAGTDFINDWDFWVYPDVVEIKSNNVLVVDTLNDKALETLKNGGNVLILGAGKIAYGKDIIQQLTPVFWNTSWFKMRPPHTIGLLVNTHHPVFKEFPTAFHSNVQWAELTNKTQVMQLSDFPEGFQPLVQNIDTWFISRKIGSLFEANVLNGKLIMTSMDLQTDLGNRIVARQMLKSILDYMNSSKFRPEFTVDTQLIVDLFTKNSENVNMFTKESPDELKPNYKKTTP